MQNLILIFIILLIIGLLIIIKVLKTGVSDIAGQDLQTAHVQQPSPFYFIMIKKKYVKYSIFTIYNNMMQ